MPIGNIKDRSAEIASKASREDLENIDLSDYITGTNITSIVKLTQAEYDALTTPSETTLYIIVG